MHFPLMPERSKCRYDSLSVNCNRILPLLPLPPLRGRKNRFASRGLELGSALASVDISKIGMILIPLNRNPYTVNIYARIYERPSRRRARVIATSSRMVLVGRFWQKLAENRPRIETPRYRLFVLYTPSYASSLFPWFSHFPAVRSPLVAELAVALLFFQLLRHPLSPPPLVAHPIIPYPPF